MALSQSGSPVVLALGVLLTVALIAGLVAQVLRLPRVTAYLLAGLVMGPNTYAVLPAWLRAYVPGIPAEYFTSLEPIGELAMALVLFNIGCQFPLDRFRKMMRRVLRLSAGELGLTFVLVSAGMLLLPLGVSWISWKVALLFGALALATAPATTILVLKENESEGPITAYATAMVALNNLAAVVLFEILYRTIHFFEGRGETDVLQEFGQFGIDLAGSTAMGFAMGLLTSYACGILSQGRWLVMFVAATTLLLGLCGLWNVPYLLAFLAMGATVANASDRAGNVVAELDRITGLLCVIFFVIHGAELDVRALYVSGAVGMAYIVLRSLGKYCGAYFAADAHYDGLQVKQWLGATLLAQAGAAIALSAIAAEGLGETGRKLQSIILGTVVFFEISGPILIRYGLLQAGEIPISQAIRHTTTTMSEELRAMTNRILVAIGLDPFTRRDPEELTVSEMMLKNISKVEASASFDEIVRCLEESHFNALPVIDDDDVLMGVIRFSNLQHVLFDPTLGALVCAEDLAVPTFHMLYPDETVTRAWQQFRHNNDDSMVVVTRAEPHRLMGQIRRRDLLRMFVPTGNRDS